MTIDCPHCHGKTILPEKQVEGSKLSLTPATKQSGTPSSSSAPSETMPRSPGRYPRTPRKSTGPDWFSTSLIAIFGGWLGIDRFFTGSTGLGVLKLITCGGCSIWSLVDVLLLLAEKYKDSEGNSLHPVNGNQKLIVACIMIGQALLVAIYLLLDVSSGFVGPEFEFNEDWNLDENGNLYQESGDEF